MLLESGTVHSISFLLKSLANTSMFPLLCLRTYAPDPFHSQVRSEFRSAFGPLVTDVGREYFGVQRLQGVFTYDGNALTANVNGRFSGILVGLFDS